MAVYNNCLKGLDVDAYDPADRQVRFIHENLCPHAERIRDSSNPMAELPIVAYEIIEDQVMSMTHKKNLTGSIILLGGIQINTPTDMQDHFQPRHFSIRHSDGSVDDLLPTFDMSHFGNDAAQLANLTML